MIILLGVLRRVLRIKYQERHQSLNSVPLWFINDHAKIKECEDKENNLVFLVLVKVSPDLNLAMEKLK